MNLNLETTEVLQRFLAGGLSTEDFGKWITSVVDDETLVASESAVLDELRLLLIEYGEGLRPLEEIQATVATTLMDAGSDGFAFDSNATRQIDVTARVSTQAAAPAG